MHETHSHRQVNTVNYLELEQTMYSNCAQRRRTVQRRQIQKVQENWVMHPLDCQSLE